MRRALAWRVTNWIIPNPLDRSPNEASPSCAASGLLRESGGGGGGGGSSGRHTLDLPAERVKTHSSSGAWSACRAAEERLLAADASNFLFLLLVHEAKSELHLGRAQLHQRGPPLFGPSGWLAQLVEEKLERISPKGKHISHASLPLPLAWALFARIILLLISQSRRRRLAARKWADQRTAGVWHAPG